jgi:sulfatase modifying factor 1
VAWLIAITAVSACGSLSACSCSQADAGNGSDVETPTPDVVVSGMDVPVTVDAPSTADVPMGLTDATADVASPSLDWVRIPGEASTDYGAGPISMFGCTEPAPGVAGPAVADLDIMRTHATEGDYAACVADGDCTAALEGSSPPQPTCTWGDPSMAAHPINCLSWAQATAFCTWAGGRLATSVEWEHAARGDAGRTYPWGETDPLAGGVPNVSFAWFDQQMNLGTRPVGASPDGATPEGLLDMAGEVWTWVEDAAPCLDVACASPSTPAREIRGVSWYHNDIRSCIRYSEPAPDYSEPGIGVRCVRAVPTEG